MPRDLDSPATAVEGGMDLVPVGRDLQAPPVAEQPGLLRRFLTWGNTPFAGTEELTAANKATMNQAGPPPINRLLGHSEAQDPNWLAGAKSFVGGMPGAAAGPLSTEGDARQARFNRENPKTALGLGLAGGLSSPMPVAPQGAPQAGRLSAALDDLANRTGRRVLRNVGGSIGASVPLPDEAVREAARSGVFRFGGTTEGAAARLETLRESLGQQKAQIMDALAAKGITGPEAETLAKQYAAQATTANATTMNPSVPRVYSGAAEQLAGKPTTAGRLSIAQAEDLKSSLQDSARSAYKRLEPTEVGDANKAAASMMRQAVEDELAKQAPAAGPEAEALAAQFNPLKDRLGNIIQAHEVAKVGAARGANRSGISLYDMLAASAGFTHGGPLEGAGSLLLSHLARTRGPSTVEVLARGAGNALGALPAVPPEVTRALIQSAPGQSVLERALRVRAVARQAAPALAQNQAQ